MENRRRNESADRLRIGGNWNKKAKRKAQQVDLQLTSSQR